MPAVTTTGGHGGIGVVVEIEVEKKVEVEVVSVCRVTLISCPNCVSMRC
jgi:threonine dehydrogenase-like Zn-dependent dehydrogenase